MVKKRNLKKRKNSVWKKTALKKKQTSRFALPEETRQKVWGIVMFLAAIIISLAFFNKAGVAGTAFMRAFEVLIGKTVIVLPFLFVVGGFIYFNQNKDEDKEYSYKGGPIILSFCFLILGLSGILGVLDLTQKELLENFSLGYSGDGGWLGNIIGFPLVKLFGFWVSQVLFLGLLIIAGLIFWHFLPLRKQPEKEEKADKTPFKEAQFETKEIKDNQKMPAFVSPLPAEVKKEKPSFTISKVSSGIELKTSSQDDKIPSLGLLEKDKDAPMSGDIKVNGAIIKRTLQNFDIPVEMSEVNIGPTVTQYTFKPAEGVKVAKITNLANDLSLALAAHPIRVEAPIPGRSLVGIEIPNKQRAVVRFRDLIEASGMQDAGPGLNLILGRDVAGTPFVADLARMPHLLVAGSTGSGKTICLNSLLLSLLYQNSSSSLKLILVDPKRVEFSVYNNLPHLLTPVIFDSHKVVNALKWLTGEMDRRFKVLAEAHARDIDSYNKKRTEDMESMPYIVLIIDELADLMASRSRDIEEGIVRIAQMARAVGIHLIIATQRPSVEVLTGLIKANITSRIAFQVASQIDSRTILDTAGAEKLLGAGDMLLISGEISKPKRIQGVYISEKEVKKVINYIVESNKDEEQEDEIEDELAQSLQEKIEHPDNDSGFNGNSSGDDDPLYEQAKEIVIEAQKASASLLQRRLRVGYARAARLIDMLEEQGVVGPGEGAKPREIYAGKETEEDNFS